MPTPSKILVIKSNSDATERYEFQNSPSGWAECFDQARLLRQTPGEVKIQLTSQPIL